MQVAPQHTAMCLKVFDLDKIEPEGSSATSPECIGILRIFTNQFPEAKVVLSSHFIEIFSYFIPSCFERPDTLTMNANTLLHWKHAS